MAHRTPVDQEGWSMLEQLAEGMRAGKVRADEAFLLGVWAGRHYADLFAYLTEQYQAQAHGERHVQMPGDKLVLLKLICDDLARQLTEQRVEQALGYDERLAAESAQLTEQLDAAETARA